LYGLTGSPEFALDEGIVVLLTPYFDQIGPADLRYGPAFDQM
jgi:hypothetical protein